MKYRKKVCGLLIIIFWLGVIFFFSGSDASASTTQTKIVINELIKLAENNSFFNFIMLKLTEKYSLVYSIRKLAHLTIFCVLQLIVFNVMRHNGKSILKASVYSMLAVILYAIFDEVHQYFIPGRSCQAKDVVIDTMGGVVGLTISYIGIILKNIFLKILNKKRR